ncbi:MAG: NAD-dependent epimerase/dehydratase family protein [Burkholderiaceae bacterium]
MPAFPPRRFARRISCGTARSPGSLPRRLRRPRLLIVGCGDVGLRLLTLLQSRRHALKIIAITRRADQQQAVRQLGAVPIAADLDQPASLRRLAAFGDWAVLLAPPPAHGNDDPRTRRLIAQCARRRGRQFSPFSGKGRSSRPAGSAILVRPTSVKPRRWTYVSTTGVYGDSAGAWLDESRPPTPASARAQRRLAAERQLRALTARGGARVSIVRAPGIYAHDRLPVDRLRRGTPALRAGDDVWTNHIHAEDLARAAWFALFRGRPSRAINAVDDSALKMGDYFDSVADALALPRPPRLSRAEISAQVTPAMLSFMSESRRLANRRLKRELRLRLRWPTVADTLHSLSGAGTPQ